MEPARHPFPVSSTARTIGEQKAKVNTFHYICTVTGLSWIWLYPFFPLRQSWPLDLLPCSALLVFPMRPAGRFPAAVAEAEAVGELCSMTQEAAPSPKRKGAALCSSTRCQFICVRGGDFRSLGLDFLELRRADKAETLIRLGRRGPQFPGDLFHIFLTRQSPVLVERAFADREANFALDIEGSAKHFFFSGTKSGDDVAARARSAQGFASWRDAPFDSNRDHSFLFI